MLEALTHTRNVAVLVLSEPAPIWAAWSQEAAVSEPLWWLVRPGCWSEASPFPELARLFQCHRDWFLQSQQSKRVKAFHDKPQKTTWLLSSADGMWEPALILCGRGNKSTGLRRQAILAGCHHRNLVSFCKKRRPELSFNTIAKSVVTNILNAHIFAHVLCETCRMFYIVMLAIIKRENGILQVKGHV